MYKRTSSALALSLIWANGLVMAQEEGKMEWGRFDVIPLISTDLLHIDNVTYADDHDENISSWVGIVSPQLKAATQFGGNEVILDYRIERGEYFSSEADNYTDHFVHLRGDFELNSRHRLDAVARYEDGHDERGRRYSNGFGNQLDSVDTYKNSQVEGIYSYGVLSASGRLDLNVGYESLDYDLDQGLYVFRDRDYARIGAQFYYQLGGSTNLVFDARRQEIDYDLAANPDNSLDSVENRYLTGVRWGSTATTRGFAKIGYTEKNFEAATREDFSGVGWELGIIWKPLSYSEIELATRADTRETNSEADYIRSQDYSISWEHAWVDRFITTATLSYYQDDYEGMAADLREDDTIRARFAADYEFRRWLLLGLFYQYSERDSTRENITYDRGVFGLSARVSL